MAKWLSRVAILQWLVVLFFALLLLLQYKMHAILPSASEGLLAGSDRDTVSLAASSAKQAGESIPESSPLPLDLLWSSQASPLPTLSRGVQPPTNRTASAAGLPVPPPVTENESGRHAERTLAIRQLRRNRLAVVIPYIGDELPAWFPLFAASAAAHVHLADWLLFTAGTQVPSDVRGDDASAWLPPNVKFIEVCKTVTQHPAQQQQLRSRPCHV